MKQEKNIEFEIKDIKLGHIYQEKMCESQFVDFVKNNSHFLFQIKNIAY